MIKVNFLTNNKGLINGFTLNGHSEYDEDGRDIVCASVSSAVYLVMNTATDVIKAAIKRQQVSSGNIEFEIEDHLMECKSLFEGLKLHLMDLQNQYPENITVNDMEENNHVKS